MHATSSRVQISPPRTFWMTGLPGAGKSTLATALRQALLDRGRNCVVLDGDVMRLGLSRDLGFSAADRRENIRRVAEVARLMNDAGVDVVSALISPSKVDRLMASEIIGSAAFLEIHVATALAVCEARDPKGLYKRARNGEISDLTGVGSPFDLPETPALMIDTALVSVEKAIERMVGLLPRLE